VRSLTLFGKSLRGLTRVPSIGLSTAFSGWQLYIYLVYTRPNERRFPEPVLTPLRKAIYYGKYRPDPHKALDYYKEAVRATMTTGMDPLSAEVLGIKISLMTFLEGINHVEQAASVLQDVADDVQLWFDKVGHHHFNDGKRTEVLRDLVRFKIKLGILYAADGQREEQEREISWAMEAMLKELERRKAGSVGPHEGDFLTNDDVVDLLASTYLLQRLSASGDADESQRSVPIIRSKANTSTPQLCSFGQPLTALQRAVY
jgi:hypothetical protein